MNLSFFFWDKWNLQKWYLTWFHHKSRMKWPHPLYFTCISIKCVYFYTCKKKLSSFICYIKERKRDRKKKTLKESRKKWRQKCSTNAIMVILNIFRTKVLFNQHNNDKFLNISYVSLFFIHICSLVLVFPFKAFSVDIVYWSGYKKHSKQCVRVNIRWWNKFYWSKHLKNSITGKNQKQNWKNIQIRYEEY